MIYPRHSNKSSVPTPMLIKTEHMEPLQRNSLTMYNRQPKEQLCPVSIKNDSSTKDSSPTMDVVFRHCVFLPIRLQFDDKPELQSDAAYKVMKDKLNELKAKELEERETVQRQRIEHQHAMETFLKNHKSVHEQPNKRPRFHAAMPTPSRDLQVHSVWTAKVQHVFSMMKVDNNNCDKHLFTFPFETVDDSLFECGHGSRCFQHSEQDESNDDKLLASMTMSEPIVVTTASACCGHHLSWEQIRTMENVRLCTATVDGQTACVMSRILMDTTKFLKWILWILIGDQMASCWLTLHLREL